MKYDALFTSPIPGIKLGLCFSAGKLTSIDFLTASEVDVMPEHEWAQDAMRRLQHYFKHPGSSLNIPVSAKGTEFQHRVWQALREIPSGDTVSYGELAAVLGSSARAVGNACRANPLPVVVPCHRVVSASGLGGFMGKRQGDVLMIKQWLLEHEQANANRRAGQF